MSVELGSLRDSMGGGVWAIPLYESGSAPTLKISDMAFTPVFLHSTKSNI